MAENRVVMDCREIPSTSNCSLRISGPEDEVLEVGVRHAIEEHGEKDEPELRERIRRGLRPEARAEEYAPTPPMD